MVVNKFATGSFYHTSAVGGGVVRLAFLGDIGPLVVLKVRKKIKNKRLV
jgi:hypothetical protein